MADVITHDTVRIPRGTHLVLSTRDKSLMTPLGQSGPITRYLNSIPIARFKCNTSCSLLYPAYSTVMANAGTQKPSGSRGRSCHSSLLRLCVPETQLTFLFFLFSVINLGWTIIHHHWPDDNNSQRPRLGCGILIHFSHTTLVGKQMFHHIKPRDFLRPVG